MSSTPFHSGHLKLLSCLLVVPTLSHISDRAGLPIIQTSTRLLLLHLWLVHGHHQL